MLHVLFPITSIEYITPYILNICFYETILVLDAPSGKPYFISPVLTYNASNTAVLTCAITSNGNPAATWTWQCGSRTFTSGTQSQLSFSVGKQDNGQQCTCRASSTVGSYNSVSDPVTLNIQCE